MDTCHIFTTGLIGSGDVVRSGTRYTFELLQTDKMVPINGPVWIFVEWLMADLAGMEMCRRIRADAQLRHSHVTMVLDEPDVEAQRRSLQAGADDYMTGPLDKTAAIDRVVAYQMSQSSRSWRSDVTIGQLNIDLRAMRARWDGRPVQLPPNEFRLLRFFADNPNQVLTRAEVIAGLGKDSAPVDERTVDVWIGRLRRGLSAAGARNALRTVRSIGYVLDTL